MARKKVFGIDKEEHWIWTSDSLKLILSLEPLAPLNHSLAFSKNWVGTRFSRIQLWSTSVSNKASVSITKLLLINKQTLTKWSLPFWVFLDNWFKNSVSSWVFELVGSLAGTRFWRTRLSSSCLALIALIYSFRRSTSLKIFKV